MNLADSETSVTIVARTFGCTEKRKVSYALLQGYHDLCLDEKDIVSAQLEVFERLLKYTADQNDCDALEQEIKKLKMALDLMT